MRAPAVVVIGGGIIGLSVAERSRRLDWTPIHPSLAKLLF